MMLGGWCYCGLGLCVDAMSRCKRIRVAKDLDGCMQVYALCTCVQYVFEGD